jgi:hypothetical protein
MSLNVNYTSLYKNGIDKSMLAEVSKEILHRAEAKSAQYAQNYSPAQVSSTAKPVELGLDLYQGKIDTSVQKQISINNTLQFQFNNETLKSIQFLNSQAAITNRVDGKYLPNVNVPTETQKISEENKSQFMSIFTSKTAKDKNGSNPFYYGELLSNNSSKREEQNKQQADSLKSIFA